MNNKAIIDHRATFASTGVPKEGTDHRMTGESRFPRIYALLRAAGHDSVKAGEILRKAQGSNDHALIWIRTLAASRSSMRLASFPTNALSEHPRSGCPDAGATQTLKAPQSFPSENEESNRRSQLLLLAYEVLEDLKTPAGEAAEGSMLALLSRGFFTASWLRQERPIAESWKRIAEERL